MIQAMRYLAVITLALLVLTGCQTFDPRLAYYEPESLADYEPELKRIRPLAEQGDAKAQIELVRHEKPSHPDYDAGWAA